MKQRRALILYATMTKNTEKVATWFKETFEQYNWDVTFIRVRNNYKYAAAPCMRLPYWRVSTIC